MQKLTKINPNMVLLGRELRGFVIVDLAEKVGISRSYMSKLENEAQEVNAEIIESLSRALNLPMEFFYQEGEILPANLSYRKREKVSSKDLSMVTATINFYRLGILKLVEQSGISQGTIPPIKSSKDQNPEEAAKLLKKIWKIDRGVVPNMTEILEKNKILVVTFDFGTDRIDGKSIYLSENSPIIFCNNRSHGDRQRFTLAYQLGHLFLHMNGGGFDRDIGHEANKFAAEFLMPEKDILQDFTEGVSIPLLAKMKRKWKVSMISLLYRAHDLNCISDNQKRYLEQQFNELKIRRREPPELDILREVPSLLRTLVTQFKGKKKLSLKDTAYFFNLYEEEFLDKYAYPG
jgi:Zn-dependent peptidase ImmA (M78 family)/DNA-binding Xre family transcriptional regulator